MKILIIHQHSRLTGVSTFLWTLVKSIKENANISVDFLFDDEDESSHLVREVGKYCTIVTKPKESYDKIFFNYLSSVNRWKNIEGEKNFFVHGLMDSDYVVDISIDRVFVFSKRSLDVYPEGILISHMIDDEKFSYSKSNGQVKKVMLLDSRSNGFSKNLLLSALSELGCYFSVLGSDQYGQVSVWNVEDYISDCDLVVGYGRSVREAISMGKPVFVYGVNGGDGLVTEENYEKLKETNFSGWSLDKLPPPHVCERKEMVEELRLALNSKGLSQQTSSLINSNQETLNKILEL